MNRVLYLWITWILIFFTSFEKFKENIEAKVIGVKDGDTYVVLYHQIQITIRLAHVDCPEKKQTFGMKAKLFGSNLCFGKQVIIKTDGTKDRNGRWIAEIFIDGKCLNKELVKNGLAWHFKKYSKNAEYAELEAVARVNKVGLWSDGNAIAPWVWRKNKILN